MTKTLLAAALISIAAASAHAATCQELEAQMDELGQKIDTTCKFDNEGKPAPGNQACEDLLKQMDQVFEQYEAGKCVPAEGGPETKK